MANAGGRSSLPLALLHVRNHNAQNATLKPCRCSANCFPTSLQRQVRQYPAGCARSLPFCSSPREGGVGALCPQHKARAFPDQPHGLHLLDSLFGPAPGQISFSEEAGSSTSCTTSSQHVCHHCPSCGLEGRPQGGCS